MYLTTQFFLIIQQYRYPKIYFYIYIYVRVHNVTSIARNEFSVQYPG